MKTKFFPSTSRIALLLPLLLAWGCMSAWADVTMQLDRNEIHQNEAAQLTVSSSGGGNNSVSPPAVAGLEFRAVNQSNQIEIVNGSMTSTSSVIYAVTAQSPGTYSIPSPDAAAKSLTLRVLPGSGGNANSSTAQSSSSLPAPPVGGSTNPPSQIEAGRAGFVRLQMPRHEIYVGENVPVTIQLGLRAGLQPSLDGLPSLTQDAFTLSKLSTKPEQTQTEINGEPYILVTWHSVMAAIKPGNFSVKVETPVTVQVPIRANVPDGDSDDSIFGNSFFRNFFANMQSMGSQPQSLTLSTEPDTIKVLPLPASGQPANFGGAVGQFEVSSEVTPSTAAAGDPLTLRLKITGSGSFDRVSSPMLTDVAGWKTYRPTEKFIPADSAGYKGEKDFDQAVIPLHPGHQTLPPVSFSFFNPESREYETVSTTPQSVDISPSSNLIPQAGPATPQPSVASATPTPATPEGLRPDETETGASVSTLRPLYFQPGFLVGQAILALAFVGTGFWLRRREQLAGDEDRTRRNQEWRAVDGFLAEMDSAAGRRDPVAFFQSARQALQHCLAWKWRMTPAAVTAAEIEAHLNGSGEQVRQVFALADEMAYSAPASLDIDFEAWKNAVHQLVKNARTL